MILSAVNSAYAKTYLYSGTATYAVDGTLLANPIQTIEVKPNLTAPTSIVVTTQYLNAPLQTDTFKLTKGKVNYRVSSGEIRKGTYSIVTKGSKTTIGFKMSDKITIDSGTIALSKKSAKLLFIAKTTPATTVRKFVCTALPVTK